jgi:hypothetical protein
MVNTGFMRRSRPDFTADVICLWCFRTVAQSKNYSDLAAAEDNHVCSPFGDPVLPLADPTAGLHGNEHTGAPGEQPGTSANGAIVWD